MKARSKNILRGVRGSLNRFLSILFIVALGAGFMAGLAATSPDMYQTADKYMDDYAMYDLDVKSTIGFNSTDAEKIAELGCVADVQAAKVVDMVLTSGTNTYTTRIFSILDHTYDGDDVAKATKLNRFVLKEGRLPRATNECVIQSPAGKYIGGNLSIGDTITLSAENVNYEQLADEMTTTTFTVVGLVESPTCIGITHEPTTVGSGTISLDMYTYDDLFTFDYITDVYVTLVGAKQEDTFSDKYDDIVARAVEEIGQFGKSRVEVRKNELLPEANKQLSALTQAVEAYRTAVANGNKLTQDDLARVEQTASVVESLGNTKLADLLQKTQDGVKNSLQNNDKQAAEKALAYYEEALQTAAEQVDAVKSAKWITRTRNDLVSFSSYDSNVGKVAALSKVFPVFFFVVALLVALTTMTRLVEERRGQIGTLKSLGFGNFQILGEYMLYSFSSSVIGCVLGLLVGFKLFPSVIASAYSMMFTVPKCITPFRWDIVAWVAPITIGSIIVATLWACWGEFVSTPATLMRPKAPQAGKRILLERIPFIWNKLSFTHKVTCRNLFRYKKRLIMTIIGISGCSALLLTGFGVRDSVNDIVDKQYGEIYKYQLTVMMHSDEWAQDEELLQKINNGSKISAYLPVCDQSADVVVGNQKQGVTLCVPSPDYQANFGDFISLRTRKGGNAIAFPKDGEVVLTEKLAEQLGVHVGDKVELAIDGNGGTATVGGITENYVSSYCYMSEDTYKSLFGKKTSYATLFINEANGVDENELVSELMAESSVLYVNASSTLRNNFDKSIGSINGVIWVLILSAGLLSAVVLYNLTNVNICERRKEIATLRVLGFHKKEARNYIFREINILSFVGSLFGLVLGVFLHAFVVKTVEVDQVMFGRDIYFLSYIYAVAITIVFTLLVNLIMRRSIDKVDMVEAMKSNE